MPLLLALAVLLLVPAAAGAATATLTTHQETLDSHNPPATAGTVAVTADAGEANRLTVTSLPGGAEVHDAAAPLRPGAGCEAVDEHRVRCQDAAVRRQTLRVDAGDGDDVVTVSSTPAHELSADVAGGDGADLIDLAATAATGWANRVSGGPGDDRVTGSPGRETFTLSAGRDTLDGGPSEDGLVNADDTSIAADMAAGTASRVDGTATFVAIETVAGTPSADRLVGGPGKDVLSGGGGDDFIDGGGGDDRLAADDPLPEGGLSLARDVVLGGDGDDLLDARGGGDRLDGGPGDDVLSPGYTGFQNARDRAGCGPGRDLVSFTGPAALLRDCERALLTGRGHSQRLDLRPASAGARWSVGIRLKCDSGFVHRRCPTRIDLREANPPGRRPGALIARRRVVVRVDAGPRRVRIGLGRRGAALLRRRGGRLPVLIHVNTRLRDLSDDDAYATVAVGR